MMDIPDLSHQTKKWLVYLIQISLMFSVLNAQSEETVEEDIRHLYSLALQSASHDSCRYYAQRGLSLAQQHGKPTLEGEGWLYIGFGWRNANVDSALLALSKSMDMLEAGEAWGLLAKAYNQHAYLIARTQGYYDALPYFEKRISYAQMANDSSSLAGGYIDLATAYHRSGQIEEALDRFEIGIDMAKRIGHWRFYANGIMNMAIIYSDRDRMDLALKNLLEAERIYRDSIPGKIPDAILNNLGTAYSRSVFDREELEIALRYFQRVLEDTTARKSYLIACNNVFSIYEILDSLEAGFPYLQKELKMARKLGNKGYEANALGNLGKYWAFRETYSRSLAYYQQALGLAIQLQNIGEEIQIKKGMMEANLNMGAYAKTIQIATDLIPALHSSEKLHFLPDVYHALAQAHEMIGSYQDALYYLGKYMSYNDSMTVVENQETIMDLKTKYESQEKEIEIARLEQEKAQIALQTSRRQTRLILWAGGIIMLLVLTFLFFRSRQLIHNRARELELQQERARKEQLAELDAMKSRFFANISHEFRTPLTLILGQNEQLQSKIDDPALDGNFEMLHRNGRRLLGLINQVLDLSKLESGKLNMQKLPLNLIPFLKNLIFSFESLAEQKKIRLHFESESEELISLVDPEKVERVFFNLISNAVKFTPEDGDIEMRVMRQENTVRIGIRDTGIGMSEDQLAYIFDRFYQADSQELSPSPGTGIGLALAKELVELHEGSLSVDSKVGQGSTFWVELPIETESVEGLSNYSPQLEPTEVPIAIATPSTTAVKATGERILIVEDNPDVRSYLDETLQGFGYDVIQAEDGLIGLEQAATHQPDLIISDVMMPRMDGLSFAKAIRADVKSSHIPLILLTAKASDDSRITGLETGVDAYLTKPFHTKELQVRIHHLIEQRKRLQQQFSTSLTIKPEEVSAVPMDQVFLQTITDTIEANLGNGQFGVEMLSEAAAISVTHLNRKLNALIGQSAGKLIRMCRSSNITPDNETGIGSWTEERCVQRFKAYAD